MPKVTRILLAAVALVMSWPAGVFAQSYPNRPITLVLPFPAGSATDGVARFVAEELRKRLNQPIIIENKPGGDGIIAAQAVMRAEPDGYTVFVTTNSTHAVNVSLYNKLPYDPVTDFLPVGGMIKIMQMFCVRSDFPADSVASFFDLAKKRTSPLSYGTGNTSSRVAGELLKAAGKIEMQSVSYRGTPQAVTDLMGGHIDIFFADPFAAISLVKDGRLKVLAVTDRQRLPLLPNVSTMIELGYKDFEVVSWVAAFLPAKTDPAIAARLNREINAILAAPESKEYIEKIGATVFTTSQDELQAFVKSEIVHWAKLLAATGIEKK